jgi:cGMP-dependent protein kinase
MYLVKKSLIRWKSNLKINYNKISLKLSILAMPDCVALECSWDNIIKNLNGTSRKKSLNVYHRMTNLRKLYLFKNLTEQKLLQLAREMRKETYKMGDLVVEEETIGDKLYLINKGRVRVTQNGKFLREIEDGSCFGEIALIKNEKRTASVYACSESISLYVLSKEDLLNIIDKNILEYIKKKIALQDTSIILKDLYYLKFLGKGKFGSVNLVHNQKNVYAIKAVSRKAADSEKILSKYFLSERRIMLSIDHPFIAKMVKSLKNESHCFFLIEFINGKNMDDYLNERKTRRNIIETKFYVSCMLVMIEYLHKKNIAHRDLKPSNIMIDQNGYLKLIDFGTSKIVTDFTNTIIGTPHYIAPEILLGKGYTISCDYWSIGICMHEIFYGCFPFGNSATDIMEIYKEVLHRELSFPHDNNRFQEVNSFLKAILTKKVNQRVCSVQKLKLSNFLIDMNFDDLIEFKIKAPYLPETWEWSKNINNILTPFEMILQVIN